MDRVVKFYIMIMANGKNLKNKWYIPKNIILSITDAEKEEIEDIFFKNALKNYVLKNEDEKYEQRNSKS